MENRKNRSDSFLIEASKLTSESKYYDAIVLCNKSLCYAKQKSNQSLAFDKRSSIYFQLKEYQKCLDDIECGSRCVVERKEKCDREIAKQTESENAWDFFKLSYKSNEKIPFIVDCLKPQVSLNYGRCIITTKSLNPGDIVAIEEPFLRMLNKETRFKRCAFCLKSNKMCLLPCPGNCTSTMFCSSTCLENAWHSFHKFECNALDEYLENDNEYDMTVLKIVFESLAICKSVDNLESLIKEVKPDTTIFDFDLSAKSSDNFRLNLLKVVLSLTKAPSSEEDIEMAQWMIDSNHFLKSICKTSSQKDFLKSFVINIMGILDRNSYILFCSSLTTAGGREDSGSGVFPFASLLNHSCSPNLYRVFVDNKQVFIVKRPIPAGDQLFVGYHAGFLFEPKAVRQEFLLSGFQFECACDACTSDFPLVNGLKRHDKFFKEPPKAENVKQAIEVFQKNCQYIKENIKKIPFPSFEICYLMQNSLVQLQFLAGFSFMIKGLNQ